MLRNFACTRMLSTDDFFKMKAFKKKSEISNSFNPDQARHVVEPIWALSVDDKLPTTEKRR